MKNLRLLFASAVVALSIASFPATAQDAFDPATFDGTMLSGETLTALADEARAATPPRNGENYVIGFANLQRDIPFGVLVEQGIVENAEAAGVELTIADNRLDGATALANAESFINRNVDYVIEFQTDAAFGPTIMSRFEQAGIPVVAIDIPMPGARFFGVDNPRAGFMAGSYLAQAAIAEFGEERARDGFFILGELPQSGPIPAMRTGGQRAGFLSQFEDFPEDRVLVFDSKNTLEESFTQTNSLLNRIPDDAVIMGTAINDQATTGILRAITAAGRADHAIVVGLGADERETLASEDRFVASVGSFPERYGNWLIPTALSDLAGAELPEAVLIKHVMVTPQNVCEFYEDVSCAENEGIDYAFPQEAFATHVEELRADPDLADVQNLIRAE